MFFTLRNEPKIMTLIKCAILGIAAIVFIVLGIIDTVRINRKSIDLNETHMDWSQLETGTHVEMDVNILIGDYMTTTNNGNVTQRDFLMPHIVYDSYNDYYTIDKVIGVKINSSDFDAADTIVSNTVAWWRDRSGNIEYNTVTIHVDGYLRKMDDTQLNYCRQAMTAAGFTPHDLAALIVPYYISDNSNSGKAFLICGAIFALAAVPLTIYAVKKKQ